MGKAMSPQAKRLLLRVGAPLLVALVPSGGVGVGLWGNSEAAQNGCLLPQPAPAARHQAESGGPAGLQGYTGKDLEPVTSRLRALDGAQQPWWIPDQPNFYTRLKARAAALQAQLDSLQNQLLTQAKADTGKQIETAKSQIAQAQQASADDGADHHRRPGQSEVRGVGTRGPLRRAETLRAARGPPPVPQ